MVIAAIEVPAGCLCSLVQVQLSGVAVQWVWADVDLAAVVLSWAALTRAWKKFVWMVECVQA